MHCQSIHTALNETQENVCIELNMFPILNCRSLKGIRGFTREIIVALIANIKSQEKRRADCDSKGLPPEHPHASATDDVEGFIANLHQLIGVKFNHKTVRNNYRKITQQFRKRVDPDLKFYYWTGVNERYVR